MQGREKGRARPRELRPRMPRVFHFPNRPGGSLSGFPCTGRRPGVSPFAMPSQSSDFRHRDKSRPPHRPEARANRHVRELVQTAPALSEDQFMELVAGAENPLVLVLDCVQDPHNLGAILRTAEAAGVLAVVTTKDKAAGVTETVRRVSVGAADRVPFARVTNLARVMERLKEAGFWLVGTSDRGTQSIYETDLTGRLALVLGAEEKGMRRLTGENCDFLAVIPMAGEVGCLNVSVAAGVCLFEAVRQRRAAG